MRSVLLVSLAVAVSLGCCCPAPRVPVQPIQPIIQPQIKQEPTKQIEQAEFTKVVESFMPKYEAAPNELQKSALRADRGQELGRIFTGTNSQAKNWKGTLRHMFTTNDGTAFIRITLEGSRKISVSNSGPLFSNLGIANKSMLYTTISTLSKGDVVSFSGTFYQGGKNHLDFITENSFTESGAMLDPEFTMDFTGIVKVK